MKIDCTSDLHGSFPVLDGGDLLVIAGDLTARHTPFETVELIYWLSELNYKKIIYISGNHDNQLVEDEENKVFDNGKVFDIDFPSHIKYLCDSSTEYEGLKIYGTPWSLRFPNMNPLCKAFTCHSEVEIANKFNQIPEDVDILVTHTPAFGTLDTVSDMYTGKVIRTGSNALADRLLHLPNLKLHVFGHIHGSYGQVKNSKYISVNAAHMDEEYKPVNKPITIMLD